LKVFSVIITALKALNFKQQGHVQISKGENRKINSNQPPRYPDPLGGGFLSQRDFS
jgi:hypothetical protein